MAGSAVMLGGSGVVCLGGGAALVVSQWPTLVAHGSWPAVTFGLAVVVAGWLLLVAGIVCGVVDARLRAWFPERQPVAPQRPVREDLFTRS